MVSDMVVGRIDDWETEERRLGFIENVLSVSDVELVIASRAQITCACQGSSCMRTQLR